MKSLTLLISSIKAPRIVTDLQYLIHLLPLTGGSAITPSLSVPYDNTVEITCIYPHNQDTAPTDLYILPPWAGGDNLQRCVSRTNNGDSCQLAGVCSQHSDRYRYETLYVCTIPNNTIVNAAEILSVSYSLTDIYIAHDYVHLTCTYHLYQDSLYTYSVGRCTDSGGRMTLSVMVKEPGYQDGRTDIGGWSCFLAVFITPLTNSINVDWLGIKFNRFFLFKQ